MIQLLLAGPRWQMRLRSLLLFACLGAGVSNADVLPSPDDRAVVPPSEKPPPAPAPPSTNEFEEPTGAVDAPPLPSHPDVEPVGVPVEGARARPGVVPDERLDGLPPPAVGFGELMGPLVKTMLMLGVVLLIVYLTLHKGLGKLVERQNLGRRVKVVERVALDQRRMLFLVDVDGKQMLLAAGEGGVVHLRDVDAPAPAGDVVRHAMPMGLRFAEALKTRVAEAPPVTSGLEASSPSSLDPTSKKA